jgi:hypothetical protein
VKIHDELQGILTSAKPQGRGCFRADVAWLTDLHNRLLRPSDSLPVSLPYLLELCYLSYGHKSVRT